MPNIALPVEVSCAIAALVVTNKFLLSNSGFVLTAVNLIMTESPVSNDFTYHSHNINRAFGDSPSPRTVENIVGKRPPTISSEYQMASHNEDILKEIGVYAAHSPAPILIATPFDDKALLYNRLHITRLDCSLCLHQKETFESIARQPLQLLRLVLPLHVVLERD